MFDHGPRHRERVLQEQPDIPHGHGAHLQGESEPVAAPAPLADERSVEGIKDRRHPRPARQHHRIFEQTVDRARSRGTAPAGTTADTTEIERSWRHRYIPAQQLYSATAHPTDHADIIVYNAQLQRPAWEDRRPH